MTRSRRENFFIILILGALSTVSPFSIDMYLPAFPDIARELGTTSAKISLSVSGYFIGLAIGQLFYGPMLDRFGRKKPLYAGLCFFIVASVGCMLSKNAECFIAFRILQALGGCVAQVAALSMVRDFFPVKESAKILSLLFLVLSVSPLFAPSIGSFIVASVGWQWIFVFLAGFAIIVMGAVGFFLPEGHKPDPTISLKPARILAGFFEIITCRHFATYAFAGAFAFAGLFVYVAGSPIIFIDTFHLNQRIYSLIFAMLACGFIGGSQVNVLLSRRHEDRKVLKTALMCQNIVILTMLISVLSGWYNLEEIVGLTLCYLACCGIAYPNAAAIALAPFSKNIGSASALLGFIQMGVGAFASTGVGLFNSKSSLPIFTVMAATAFIGLLILIVGQQHRAQH